MADDPLQQLPELHLTPDKYLPLRYAGASGDFNPIHIDPEFAVSVGLPGAILHGLWTMAQVARAHIGPDDDPARLKRLSVEFRGVALPERQIVVRGGVRDRSDGEVTVASEVLQDDKRVIRNGQAVLTIPGH